MRRYRRFESNQPGLSLRIRTWEAATLREICHQTQQQELLSASWDPYARDDWLRQECHDAEEEVDLYRLTVCRVSETQFLTLRRRFWLLEAAIAVPTLSAESNS